MKANEPWITVKQAAERLAMHRSMIYRLLNQKVLHRVWLIMPNPRGLRSKGRFGVSMDSIAQYEHSLRIVNEREASEFQHARKG
ncbi:MAG: hypothetical protein Q7U76_12780 [Nitrospirota bacterium]|nr:hypothetical protein [Nitrospirota bacterium]